MSKKARQNCLAFLLVELRMSKANPRCSTAPVVVELTRFELVTF